MSKISRRKFFTAAGAGLAAFGLSGKLSAKTSNGMFDNVKNAEKPQEEIKIRKYNNFGNTGLKISEIIFGSAGFFSPKVAQYAMDLGINTFDTGESYMNGKSEEYLGNALKGRRDKAAIITKLYYGVNEPHPAYPMTRANLTERVNGCLKRLNTDYIDFLFIHNVDTPVIVKNEELQLGFQELKKAGKIRFSGISTHNAKEMLKIAVEPALKDFMQAVLFMYNHMEGKEIEPLIHDVRNAGIGTIAMKVLAGGKHGSLQSFIGKDFSYPQAALRWVLGNKDIDCANMSMVSFVHVDEYVAASGKSLERKDLAILKRYQREVDHDYCRVSCNLCEAACPNRVAISDIMRYEMYFKDYGHQKAAVDAYSALDDNRKPNSCADCSGHCNARCPFGLNVKERLIDTHDILSV